MKRSITLKSKFILLVLCATTAIFDATFLLGTHLPGWLQLLINLPIALLLPGVLSLLLLGARKVDLTNSLFAIGLSCLELLLIGLAANYIPDLFGATQPLNTAAIPILFNSVILIQLAALFANKRRLTLEIPRPSLNIFDVRALVMASLIILLSIFGTFHLNNYGSNVLSMSALALMLVAIAGVVTLHKRLNTFALVVLLFSMSLATLLLVSLRSWDISGHDIKNEYMVYTLTSHLGKWSIANYRNAYNACLSITIFPIVFTKLLHTSGYVVFKFIFQLLFTVCPIAVFVLLRQYTSRLMAFLGATFFISFPTFTTDSPMLTRQEVAFVFFFLVLIAWFTNSEDWLKNRWRALFLLMSLGVILSHYSTTYMYVILLLLTYLFSKIPIRYLKLKATPPRVRQASGTLVLVVTLGAFAWYAQATRTSNHLTGVISNSFKNITNLLSQDNRDTSVNYSLFGFGSNNGHQLATFIDQTKSNKSIEDNQVINSLTFVDNTIPASHTDTVVGRYTHINVSSLIHTLYYSIGPRIYQIFVLLGIGVICFSRRVRKKILPQHIPLEYILLCVAGIIVLGLQVLLPNISLNYGLMRAFQQTFAFLVLPLIVGIFWVGEALKRRGTVLVTAMALLMLALFTNFLPQMTGGVRASLNLNNSGPYYGDHYVHKSDLLAFAWLKNVAPRNASVRSADASAALEHDPYYPFTKVGILPFQVNQSSYIVLQYYQVTHNQVYINVAHNLLPVQLSTSEFASKNLIYATQTGRVYK